MNWIINIFIAIPLLGLLISFLIPEKNERLLSRVAFYTAGLNLIAFIIFLVFWGLSKFNPLNIKEVVLYRTDGYEFLVDFYLDKISAVYLFVGAVLTYIITIYSRYYLHREDGYKRFFNTILFFYAGFNIVVLSGNFETLFIGWEMLGISSFLLIAFYRTRYLPVRNAVKIFAIYRIGDVGILLAMWASHHLWHENITFLKLSNNVLVHEHLLGHSSIGIFISVMILLAAAAKSAQLPFSSWLPRAMEGPTPSSAIFYGSLSVHFGVFLLLRTHTFWENQYIVRILIAIIGVSTSIIASFIARVQASIKSKVAYSSISQIGLIFLEIALGFDNLALVHFAGNAFLRTYQLLVSPSVVSYLIREQFYHFVPRKHTIEEGLPKRLEYSLYFMGIKEFNLDVFMQKWVFKPLKNMGHKLDFLRTKNILFYFIPAYFIGLFFLFHQARIPEIIRFAIPGVLSFIGLLMVLKSFSERHSPGLSWWLLVLNHFWIALAVSFNEKFEMEHVLLYLSGVIVCGVLGYWVLHRLRVKEPLHYSLNQYYGHVYEYPKLALFFLICSLGVMGFPITATFIGEDVIFSHIRNDQFALAIFNSIGFIVSGISLIRIYSRLFLGPHVKTYHETPIKSI